MSARPPFRSHLLQQWTNSRRSPIVLQQWLHTSTIEEEEENVRNLAPTRSSRHGRSNDRRSLSHSSRQHHPILSSVDSLPSSPSIAPATTAFFAASLKSKETTRVNRIDKELSSAVISADVPFDGYRTIAIGKKEDCASQKTMPRSELLHHSATGLYPGTLRDMPAPRDIATDDNGMPSAPLMNSAGSSMIIEKNNYQEDDKKDQRGQELRLAMAINRAVKMAKTTDASNHQLNRNGEREQPFTFRTLFSSSRLGQRLIDVCFNVTKSSTNDDSLARTERETWSKVPAFLVAIVHNNQREVPVTNAKIDDDDDFPYKALDYSPPINEGQLEDYASACAAVQRAIHSLGGDGFATKWVTGSVIKTPAFRSLVKAKSTDRVAALLMVHNEEP